MSTLVFDPLYGCAGDMILGAFVATGAPFDQLKSELAKLDVSGFEVSMEQTHRNQISCVKVHVKIEEQTTHRHLKHIVNIIDNSELGESVKRNAKAIFRRLAESEAQVHSTTIDKVHFHEVGAVDAIVDIVGACICIDLLKIDRILSRPIALGSGMVKCAHGVFPVPAPATVNLIKGFPVVLHNIDAELTTPTGAAIITTLAEPLLNAYTGTIKSVGYGAGSRVFEDHPNVMRLFIAEDKSDLEHDSIVELHTNIDDMNPQVYSQLFEQLLASGALDVFLTPVQMKKGRPGQMLTVLCDPDKKENLQREIFRQTTSAGIRCETQTRVKLPRRQETVSTSLGDCVVKIFEFEGRSRVVPEYESVKKIADKNQMSYLAAYEKITRDLSDIDKE
ncbi:MAG: nickel pincer cofactor biosynthesis protein LarC [Candidatus Zixiibacteriota bacterium]